MKFWDQREKRFIHQLEPYKDERFERMRFGKWQGTVSITDDWLLRGVGPKRSLFVGMFISVTQTARSCNCLDICMNFKYKDIMLKLYEIFIE